MLVKIISGTYGHRPILPNGKKSHYVIPVTVGMPPIEVEEAEGTRLIGLGVAVKAEAKDTKAPVMKAVDESSEAVSEDAIYTTDMSQAELRAAMDAAGLPYDGRTTKKQMVAALNAADEAPVLEVEDVVD